MVQYPADQSNAITALDKDRRERMPKIVNPATRHTSTLANTSPRGLRFDEMTLLTMRWKDETAGGAAGQTR